MKTEPYDLRIIRILEPLSEQIWVTSMLTVLNETQATLKRASGEASWGTWLRCKERNIHPTLSSPLCLVQKRISFSFHLSL